MFFTLKEDLTVVRCFMHLSRKRILVFRMQKERKKTSKGDYLTLSLMLSYNDGPKVKFEREISTYVSMHG